MVLEAIKAGDAEDARRLSETVVDWHAPDILRTALNELFPGRIAVVSSFGAESAVLLHMTALIGKKTPVIFVDTGHLFAETLAYRDDLVRRLGLESCRTFRPEPEDLALHDPEEFLWSQDPDGCCKMRKVVPLSRALEGYDAWVSGRKRFQARTREALAPFEVEGQRTKINPLAAWSAQDILTYMADHDLPAHPLVARRFLSIGCMPCTSPVRPGEDARAGRWRGKGKTECGIHTSFIEAGAGI